jgi:alkylated DNA repair dioxygenase AlkB
MHNRDKQGRSDDGPENRKRVVVDGDHEPLGQVQVMRDERAQKSPHEADGDGDQKAPSGSSADGAANRATNARNDQKKHETCKRQCHSLARCKDRAAGIISARPKDAPAGGPGEYPPVPSWLAASSWTAVLERSMRSFELSDGARIALEDRWLAPAAEQVLFRILLEQVPWQAKTIRIAGRPILEPRLTAWYGDEDAVYTYSGLRNVPMPWIPALLEIRVRLERELSTPFNGALLNYYRTGNDSMGFHADDEPELGRNPVVASVSLGTPRRFVLRHVKNKDELLDLDLPGGSLLVMSGTTQHHFRHAVPKQPGKGQRINLTFRRVLTPSIPAARPAGN